jgi:hypothetical protein
MVRGRMDAKRDKAGRARALEEEARKSSFMVEIYMA